MGLSLALFLAGFRAAGTLGPVLRTTENENFSATAVGARSLLFAGYRGDRFGLGVELGYEQIFATHISHTDACRKLHFADAKDGWYGLTAGTWRAGLRGGGRLGPVELHATGGVLATQEGTF